MATYKIISYTMSVILWLCSMAIVALSLKLDYEGYIMASQTLMLAAGVVAIWAMTALLAGKG